MAVGEVVVVDGDDFAFHEIEPTDFAVFDLGENDNAEGGGDDVGGAEAALGRAGAAAFEDSHDENRSEREDGGADKGVQVFAVGGVLGLHEPEPHRQG